MEAPRRDRFLDPQSGGYIMLKRNQAHVSMVFGLAAIGLAFVSPADARDRGAHRGDAQLTCAQLAAELMHYMGPMVPNVAALNATNQKILATGRRQMAEQAPVAAAATVAATAASADLTGVSSRAVSHAYNAQQMAAHQREIAEMQPLADRQKAQAQALVNQAQRAQANPRIQRLMQLGHDKGCDR
jgi:hypothetical protein